MDYDCTIINVETLKHWFQICALAGNSVSTGKLEDPDRHKVWLKGLGSVLGDSTLGATRQFGTAKKSTKKGVVYFECGKSLVSAEKPLARALTMESSATG